MGCGTVGSAPAYALVMRGVGREIVLRPREAGNGTDAERLWPTRS